MNRIKTAPPWMRISQRTYVTECALGSIKLKNISGTANGQNPPLTGYNSFIVPHNSSFHKGKTEKRDKKPLKLGSSVTQYGSFFKRTFFKKPLIFEKTVKKATKLLHTQRKKQAVNCKAHRCYGASCLTRTGDTLINSQVL